MKTLFEKMRANRALLAQTKKLQEQRSRLVDEARFNREVRTRAADIRRSMLGCDPVRKPLAREKVLWQDGRA